MSNVPAFWLDFECVRNEHGMQEDEGNLEDVYRICDYVRAAHSMIIAVGPPNEVSRQSYTPSAKEAWLLQWGTRIWTLPEALLCPSESRIAIYTRGSVDGPEWVAKRNLAKRVWRDAKQVRQLMDHFESSLHLTPLELVSIASECLFGRDTEKRTNGDVSYALQGLMRRRPEVVQTDSDFEAFAKLSLANDNDKLLERLLCMQPRPKVQDSDSRAWKSPPWYDMKDALQARLWDIDPICQVSGIVDNRTVTLDGAFGATIRWKSLKQVAFFKERQV